VMLIKALLLLTPTLPLLFAVAYPFARARRIIPRLATIAALPALLLALLPQNPIALDLPWLLLGTRLELDSTGQVFLGFTAFLWLIATAYTPGYFRSQPEQQRQPRFFLWLLLTMAGNLGLIVAQDAASFFLFFALMSFAAYGLVVHNGDAQSRYAGRIYLTWVVIGEVLLFCGLSLCFFPADSLYLTDLTGVSSPEVATVLLVLAFAIKAGVLLLHVWLPLAHGVAPAPASAVLSGAMLKAGLLGWLRFLPLGEVAMTTWGWLFVTTGLIATFYGAVVGLLQCKPKPLLAYSSVSQMGLLTLLVGAGMLAPEQWPLLSQVILLFALHHALAKGALFLGIPLVENSRGTAKKRLIGAITLPALALAGAPFSSGMLAKVGIKATLPLWSDSVQWLIMLLTLSSLATSLLMLRLLQLLYRSEPHGSPINPATTTLWLFSLIVMALTTWLWPGSTPFRSHALSADALLSASFPLLLALALGWGAVRWGITDRWSVAPGDILWIYRHLISRIVQLWHFIERLLVQAHTTLTSALQLLIGQSPHRHTWPGRWESYLQRWETGSITFVILIVLLFWLLLFF